MKKVGSGGDLTAVDTPHNLILVFVPLAEGSHGIVIQNAAAHDQGFRFGEVGHGGLHFFDHSGGGSGLVGQRPGLEDLDGGTDLLRCALDAQSQALGIGSLVAGLLIFAQSHDVRQIDLLYILGIALTQNGLFPGDPDFGTVLAELQQFFCRGYRLGNVQLFQVGQQVHQIHFAVGDAGDGKGSGSFVQFFSLNDQAGGDACLGADLPHLRHSIGITAADGHSLQIGKILQKIDVCLGNLVQPDLNGGGSVGAAAHGNPVVHLHCGTQLLQGHQTVKLRTGPTVNAAQLGKMPGQDLGILHRQFGESNLLGIVSQGSVLEGDIPADDGIGQLLCQLFVVLDGNVLSPQVQGNGASGVEGKLHQNIALNADAQSDDGGQNERRQGQVIFLLQNNASNRKNLENYNTKTILFQHFSAPGHRGLDFLRIPLL